MSDESREWERMADELRNFQEIARLINPSPGELPRLDGVDVHGIQMPLRHVIGGDHILYVNFKTRYDLDGRIAAALADGKAEVAARLRELRRRAGVLVADVSGHRMTDALIAAMLHQAFLLGVSYELDAHGEISTTIFEHINARFHQTNSVHKFLTMIYGEIWDDGRFRFISAGHPPPAVYSREFGKFAAIGKDRLVSLPPVGIFPSRADQAQLEAPLLAPRTTGIQVNEIQLLSPGDILLLYTDGLAEHADGAYFPTQLEQLLSRTASLSAEQICERLRADLLRAARPADDISFVVAKRVR